MKLNMKFKKTKVVAGIQNNNRKTGLGLPSRNMYMYCIKVTLDGSNAFVKKLKASHIISFT